MKKAGFFLMAAVLWTATPGLTTVYFVDPSGSDSNPGSESKPWRNIQKAANVAGAGDTVYVKQGIYSSASADNVVRFERSGEPDAYITFLAYPGQRPVNESTARAALRLVGASCDFTSGVWTDAR